MMWTHLHLTFKFVFGSEAYFYDIYNWLMCINPYDTLYHRCSSCVTFTFLHLSFFCYHRSWNTIVVSVYVFVHASLHVSCVFFLVTHCSAHSLLAIIEYRFPWYMSRTSTGTGGPVWTTLLWILYICWYVVCVAGTGQLYYQHDSHTFEKTEIEFRVSSDETQVSLC